MPPTKSTKKVLIIGGFDPTGHAGVLRDFEACLRFETPALTFVTAWTAQNDQKFFGYSAVDPKQGELVWKSLASQKIGAIKIGMLGNETTVDSLIRKLTALKKNNPKIKIVWDPVFASSSGGPLITPPAKTKALKHLLRLTDVFTPNAEEACRILGVAFNKNWGGQILAESLKSGLPAHTALYLKGGHLETKSRDWFLGGGERFELQGKTFATKLRGTGCLFATATACGLNSGLGIMAACEQAKEFLDEMFAATKQH